MNEEGISSKDVYYEGCLDGQMAERAAIVSWLHSCGDGICAECNANADLIESGEHLRGRR